MLRVDKVGAWAGIALAAVLCSCARRAPERVAPPPPSVTVAIATQETITPHLTLSGIIAPAQNVAISSALAEPADAVNVQEGDHVRQGEVLAVLDTADLRATLAYDLHTAASDRAQTTQNVYSGNLSISQGNDSVQQARANLQAAQTTLQNDQLNLSRDEQLLSQGYIAQQAVDTQRTTVQNDQQTVRNDQAAVSSAMSNQQANGTMSQGLQAAKVAQSRAQSEAALSQADQTRASIVKATIVSPVTGVVVNRNLNVGEYPGTRQIFTLQETDYVFAILSASSADVFAIPRGASVQLTASGRNGALTGTVVAVLDQLTPGSTNFAVKVRVPNPQGILHSGMSVSSRVSLSPASGTTVPVAAFLDDNHNSVMTVADGVAHIATVTERASDGTNSVVTGLPPAAQVVTNGQLGLIEGQRVAVRVAVR